MRCLVLVRCAVLLLAASALAGLVPAAEIPFMEHVLSDRFSGPHHCLVVDLDEDGDNDILACAYDAGDILWWENGGSGSFTERTVVQGNLPGAQQAAVADLDGDGDQDVVAAGFTGDVIAWWANDGNESFLRANIATGFVNPTCVFVVDLDGDTDQDVLASSYFQDKISWFVNDGNETFTRTDLFTSVNGAQWVWAGDLDGDTDIDVVGAAYHGDNITWWENNGSQSFTSHLVTSNPLDGPNSFVVLDMEEDGDLDLAAAAFLENRVCWYENNGAMSFTFHNVDNTCQGASAILAADLDGDGDNDLAATAFNGDLFAWYDNDGVETFTRRAIHDALTSPVGAAAGDLDGDLDLDLAATSYFLDEMIWFESGGAATFQILAGPGPGQANEPRVRGFNVNGTWNGVTDFLAYSATGYGVNVAAGDITGDGLAEIVTGAGPGAVYGPHVRAFQLDGTPLAGVSFLAYGTHKFGVNVACGDVDGDGIEEIVTGAGPGAVFGPHVRGWNFDGASLQPIAGISFFAYGTQKWGVNVDCADVDGDGIEEILTGAGPGAVFGPHVRGWNFDGGATTTPLPGLSFLAYGTPRFGVRVSGGDLDGDGRAEILTAPGPATQFPAHIRGFVYTGAATTPLAGVSFVAYGDWRFGARVAGADLDFDGFAEILTGPGPDPNNPTLVKGWNYDGSVLEAIPGIEFHAFDEASVFYGVNVAGAAFE